MALRSCSAANHALHWKPLKVKNRGQCCEEGCMTLFLVLRAFAAMGGGFLVRIHLKTFKNSKQLLIFKHECLL
jgi:hypothetical protein